MGNAILNLQKSNDVDLLNDSINNFCVTIFSKERCIYCKKVKEVFNKHGIVYHTVELDKPSCKNIQRLLVDRTGSHTVPQIFINGSFIGGAKEAQKLIDNGVLSSMLQECSHNKVKI